MSLKAAVIGVGSMGRNHARIYSDMSDVDLVAIADPNEEAALAVSSKFGGKAYFAHVKSPSIIILPFF